LYCTERHIKSILYVKNISIICLLNVNSWDKFWNYLHNRHETSQCLFGTYFIALAIAVIYGCYCWSIVARFKYVAITLRAWEDWHNTFSTVSVVFCFFNANRFGAIILFFCIILLLVLTTFAAVFFGTLLFTSSNIVLGVF